MRVANSYTSHASDFLPNWGFKLRTIVLSLPRQFKAISRLRSPYHPQCNGGIAPVIAKPDNPIRSPDDSRIPQGHLGRDGAEIIMAENDGLFAFNWKRFMRSWDDAAKTFG